MGLDDPEDVIPAIIVIVAVLGLIGAIATYIEALGNIPYFSMITELVNTGFMFLANLLAPFIPLEPIIIAILIEFLLIIIGIIIIVKVGI
jgi:hypothetical protein